PGRPDPGAALPRLWRPDRGRRPAGRGSRALAGGGGGSRVPAVPGRGRPGGGADARGRARGARPARGRGGAGTAGVIDRPGGALQHGAVLAQDGRGAMRNRLQAHRLTRMSQPLRIRREGRGEEAEAMAEGGLALFALNASRPFAERVAAQLGTELGAHEERDFEDGEHKARPLESVRGRNCYVVQSLYGGPDQSANDKLCRLLFFIGALKDAAAASVTAVVPYLCYARKDRKTKPRDPVTTRYLACLFEAVGVDRVVTLDVHNLAAFQNSFRCRTEHLSALPLFIERFAPIGRTEPVAVVSPDIGGAKRARAFAEALERATGQEVPSAFVEKHRSGGVVTGGAFAGEVRDRIALIVDDLIS